MRVIKLNAKGSEYILKTYRKVTLFAPKAGQVTGRGGGAVQLAGT